MTVCIGDTLTFQNIHARPQKKVRREVEGFISRTIKKQNRVVTFAYATLPGKEEKRVMRIVSNKPKSVARGSAKKKSVKRSKRRSSKRCVR